MKISNIAIFFLSLSLSLLILAICYPGFMSYDSIRMLEEARSSVRGGIYPAAPVYLLRMFDVFGNGPTLMLLTQNFFLLFSLALIFRMLGAGIISSTISLIVLVAMPTVIGCMLVLWKDVTLASLIMLSITMIFLASQTNRRDFYYKATKCVSILLLIIGTLIRFNAITATAVITLYWLSIFCRNQGRWRKAAVFFLIIFCMVASNKIINNYGFPYFHNLETNNLGQVIMSYDLVGISGWSRISLIPFDSAESAPVPKEPMSDIDKIYSSLGALAINDKNIAFGNIVNISPKIYNNEDITSAWLSAIASHPMAYLSYRWDIFSEIIGAKNHETFEPTHFNKIDDNKFGIKFKDRWITIVTLKFIKYASNTFIGKPWFIFLISAISTINIFKNKFIKQEFKMLSYYSFLAASLYIIPFFVISGTGEVRYTFPSIVLCSISIFILYFTRVQKFPKLI